MKTKTKPQKELTPIEIERTQRAWVANITEEDRREAVKYGYCMMFADRSAENLEAYMNRAAAAGHVPALVASVGMLSNRMAIMLARKDRALRRVQAFMMIGTEDGYDPRASMPTDEASVYADVVKALGRAHVETL
jgi:hypothetical protein